MKESELMTTILGPMVDELGMARATAAMTAANPMMDAMSALLTTGPKDQTTMDAIRVVEFWCKGMREICDKLEAHGQDR